MSALALHDLIRQLDRAPHGTKGQLVERFARDAGLSTGQVYRRIQAERGRKRPRTSQTRVPDAAIRAIESVRQRCSDRDAGRVLPADLAIELAEQNGLVEPGSISPGQFYRRVKGKGYLRTRRVARYQATRSNELHHVDASGSEYLRVVKRKGELLIAVDPPGRSWKNRPRDHAERLWVYGIVDDHSRVGSARYVMAPGESSIDTINCLAWAWSDGDPQKVLSGLPDRLCCDNGPFISSREGQQFLHSLDIEHVPRAPYNARAGGKVERPWRTRWQRFELQFLADADRLMTLEELNILQAVYDAREARRAHPWEKGLDRVGVYLRDRGDVRLLPEGYLRASFRPDYRTVAADGTIRYENTYYKAPDDLVGERVHVYASADGQVACSGLDGMVFLLEPFAPHPAGEYHTPEPQPGDLVAKLAEDLPAMAPTYADAEPPATVPIPARGQAVVLHTPFDRAGKFPSVATALLYLTQRVGKPLAWFEPAHLARIEALLAEHELACEYVNELADELRDLA